MRSSGRPRHVLQPFEREGEVRAAPRSDHGMDFVDDDRADRAQHLAAALGRQQQVERLRRGDEDVRRRAQHRRAFSAAVVSPVRTAAVILGARQPVRVGEPHDLRRGSARFLWMSALSALSGDT